MYCECDVKLNGIISLDIFFKFYFQTVDTYVQICNVYFVFGKNLKN